MKTTLTETENPLIYEINLYQDKDPLTPFVTGRLTRTSKHAWQHSLSPTVFPTRDRTVKSFVTIALNTRTSCRKTRED